MIQWIQSRRALGVMSDHTVRVFGAADASAFFRSGGTSGSVSFARRRDLERDDVACVCARRFAELPVHFEPVAFLAVRFERGLKREAIDGAFDRASCLAEGSFALAFFGRVRNIQESPFALSAGRKSFALKRIVEADLAICLGITNSLPAKQQLMVVLPISCVQQPSLVLNRQLLPAALRSGVARLSPVAAPQAKAWSLGGFTSPFVIFG